MLVSKRKADVITGSNLDYNESLIYCFTSFNLESHSWGFKPGAYRLTVIRNQRYHQMFKIESANNGYCFFKATGGPSAGDYLSVDPNSGEIILSRDKGYFRFELSDSIGNKQLVRIRTKDMRYLRHASYILRVDERSETDRPWAEDSLWWVSNILLPKEIENTNPNISFEDECMRFRRPLFMHIQHCFESSLEKQKSLEVLRHYAGSLHSGKLRKHEDSTATRSILSYPLQGAGGMGEARASAISTYRPKTVISVELKARIESASTVRSRGGVESFLKTPPAVSEIIRKLGIRCLREIRRMGMFGLVSRRDFELELGFCEWVTLPSDSEIVPHRDGSNDCDVAAIFCIQNKAVCQVEDTCITLDEGEMYIFEPQKYVHSVGKPLNPGSREVVALRFFRRST
jgi:hypothetical protein